MSKSPSCAPKRKPRSPTASQIAKDSGRFEQWSRYNHLVVGNFDKDLPKDLRQDVEGIFNNSGLLPESWINQELGASLAKKLGQEFVEFLHAAKESSASLFSPTAKPKKSKRYLQELQNVFLAYQKLAKMRQVDRVWTEADYAAQVYNVLRAVIGVLGDHRAHCPLSLPQPFKEHIVTKKAAPNLNARTIRPDGSLFVPTDQLDDLCSSVRTPFNVLTNHRNANNSGSHGGTSSFRWQSTLCAKLPARSCFEIASCFWEDKRAEQKELEVAYRQNRMATTAALRQLHALGIQAPIIGLVWAEGTVRAHVDWYEVNEDGSGELSIVSAPYPGPPSPSGKKKQLFHSWDLAKPADIIEVYLLLRKLDHWTVNGFRNRAVAGIQSLVGEREGKVLQWRRRGILGKGTVNADKPESESEPESISTPPRTRSRSQKQQVRR